MKDFLLITCLHMTSTLKRHSSLCTKCTGSVPGSIQKNQWWSPESCTRYWKKKPVLERSAIIYNNRVSAAPWHPPPSPKSQTNLNLRTLNIRPHLNVYTSGLPQWEVSPSHTENRSSCGWSIHEESSLQQLIYLLL
jgi:hypothetical protein